MLGQAGQSIGPGQQDAVGSGDRVVTDGSESRVSLRRGFTKSIHFESIAM